MKGKKIRISYLLATSLLLATQTEALATTNKFGAKQTTFEVRSDSKIKVNGTILDSSGLSVIGASVLEKGTTNGVITDLDGNFALDVSEGAVLVISYVGYVTQEIKAVPHLKITLQEDNQALEEVVVIGYGVQKKSNVTGSISSIKNSDFNNRTVTEVNQALQGKVAGVHLLSTSDAPGSGSSVRIRGFSSNSTSNPLYVVDGIRMPNINEINPSDIESMEVLKDAASAAIYGAEAGNGVILITTKKGQTGRRTISYDFQYAIQSLQRKPEVLDAQQYIGYMVGSGAMTQEKADTWDGTNTCWADVLFEPSSMQKHTLNFTGGNDRGTLYASINYLDNNGIVVGNHDAYKRFGGSVNASYKIKEWLKLSIDQSVGYFKRDYVAENSRYNSVLRAALALDPLTRVTYTPENMPQTMAGYYEAGLPLIQDGNGNYYSISNYVEGEDVNPFILMKSGHNRRYGYSLRGNFALDLTPLKGMVFTSRVGYFLRNSNEYNYQGAYYANGIHNQSKERIRSSVDSNLYLQWENFINYTLDLGNHNLTSMLGTSFSTSRYNYVATGGEGLVKGDENYAFPDYLSSNASSLVHEGDEFDTRKLSYFGRLSYNYRGRYMAQFTMRADAADLSILPRNKRWGYFPAFSLGWTLSDEEWFPEQRIMSSAKLRASWGQNGSIAGLSNFSYASAITTALKYTYDMDNPNYTTGSMPSSTGNENLKWETSEQLDFGLDTRFFDDRLTFNMDYYIKKTRDLIVSGSTPTLTIGNTVSPVNAGNIENKGFEFELGWKDNIGDFSYSVNGNLATLDNKVTYLDPSITRINGYTYSNKTFTAFEKGYPVWYFRGYKVDHIDAQTGNPLYVAADGSLTEIPNTSDMTMIGSAVPDFNYGISVSLNYKNWDFNLFGQGSYGNDVCSCLTRTDRRTANRLACYYTDAWTPENTNARYARIDYPEDDYWQSSAVIFDGSYFRIKQIQLGYSLPDLLLKRVGLTKMRVYCSLDDFFTFTSYPGLDPEASAGEVQSLGIDLGSYPTAKKVVLGFNLTF